MTSNSTNTTCTLHKSSVYGYCATYLQQYTDCLRLDSNLSYSDIYAIEPPKLAVSEVDGILEFIRLSVHPFCLASLEPLMCLHFFHLCDEGMQDIGPSEKQCNHIFSVCDAEELKMIQDYSINIYDYLLKCSQTNNPFNMKGCSIVSNVTAQPIANCSEGFFYQDVVEGCVPECTVWTPHSKTKALVVDIITTFPLLIGTICGTAVILISWIHRRKL